jgi:FG-GAP repeat
LQVIIFNGEKNLEKKLITSITSNDIKDTESTQPGEYFGHSLASGDFNGDGSDEIIIGSPFFFASTGSAQGRVFIFQAASSFKVNFIFFKNSNIKLIIFQKMELWTTLPIAEELDSGARFGYSVASLLNINSDKFCGTSTSVFF